MPVYDGWLMGWASGFKGCRVEQGSWVTGKEGGGGDTIHN